jgi:Zn-dependent protease with chaperone function
VNFFDAQDNARKQTRWLVIVYIVATMLIVAGVTVLFGSAMGALDGMDTLRSQNQPITALLAPGFAAMILIFGATAFKTAQLSSGGSKVAVAMGGTLVSENVQDPLRSRLRNVVEEMAIASGVPVPEIYVMEEEAGINAFAAGFTPSDAAVAVTRGTLELLDRDELQGVIAHEFSHILNGDMRLNIRMMGVLFGIMVIGMLGRLIMRGAVHSRNKKAGGVVILGVGLLILGWVGVFFARLIKAAVSRQREFLADASAVQFTRQADGISNALKKIGGFQSHSYIKEKDPEEVSHMLFALGSKFSGMFATHPPLAERIRAIDPQFDGSTYPQVSTQPVQAAQAELSTGQASGFVSSASAMTIAPESLAATVGQPGPEHIAFAQQLRRSIPRNIVNAAHSPANAYLITLALVIDPSGETADKQIDLLQIKLGDDRGELIRSYYDAIRGIGEQYRLPLLEISFPALKKMSEPRLEFLLDLARQLIEMDGRIDFYEFCIFRIISNNLARAKTPAARLKKRQPTSRQAVRKAATQVLSLLADRGHDTKAEKEQAFKAGLSVFGEWSEQTTFDASSVDAVAVFEGSLDVLQRINSAATMSLLEAINTTAGHDGKISIREAEMIRAICSSLDCPLPPILPTTIRV